MSEIDSAAAQLDIIEKHWRVASFGARIVRETLQRSQSVEEATNILASLKLTCTGIDVELDLIRRALSGERLCQTNLDSI